MTHESRTLLRECEGRVALVTGGSRGVGRAIVRRLAAGGASVAVNYRRDVAAAEEVAEEIVRSGGVARAYQAAVDDQESVSAMLSAIRGDLGEVDLLVSNAGTASHGKRVADTDDEEYLRLLRVHVLGPLRLVRLLLPRMRTRTRSDVVFVSSAIVDLAPAGGAAYTMAKAAVEAAARTLAREERNAGVRVNVVAPGLVATEMGERLVRASSRGTSSLTDLDSHYPFGRVCRPEDVAGVVAFLVSANADYVTGQRIVVDGGGPDVGTVALPDR